MNPNDLKITPYPPREQEIEYYTLMSMSRCDKCVYGGTCKDMDLGGTCPNYKRDAPDGGYYG